MLITMAICIAALICLSVIAVFGEPAEEVSYASALFDTAFVHTIDITMDESDWAAMKENAMGKEIYHGDIVIDGEQLSDVGISTKGSNTLRGIVSNNDLNRYSLKLKFGTYREGQTYRGLDVLNLNNNFSDASQMKDYISYEMFRKLGVASPLAAYAKVSVNSEYYGIFLVVEDMKTGFLNRNFDGNGVLYKPEAVELTAINGNNNKEIQDAASENREINSENIIDPFDVLSPYFSGADLRYSGDSIEAYPDIFENISTPADEEDMKSVITALKNLSEGNVEKAVDVDEVIAYFVVHNFTGNYDSYTGLLGHDYYLYENDGLLSMLPWDYNYYDSLCTEEYAALVDAIGKVHVDADIDAPLMVPEDSRPMWSWIVSEEKYLEKYHAEINRFLEECFDSGWAYDELSRVDTMIRADVQSDPNAVYTVEEYDAAFADLFTYFEQRAASMKRQATIGQ